MFAGTVILAALFFTVVFMKLSESLTKFWPTLIVFALFVIGAAPQTLAMKRADLAVTYCLWWVWNRSSHFCSVSCCSARAALRCALPAAHHRRHRLAAVGLLNSPATVRPRRLYRRPGSALGRSGARRRKWPRLRSPTHFAICAERPGSPYRLAATGSAVRPPIPNSGRG